ncbi:DJ-1/PfpI family protein [Vibrio rotiferianus]|uniref:DJ-1/PfpI family protein n=1 Tax=Vibrio rotiferianus TaxID=190895 RepID=UPI0028941463|nr:Thiamine biosynthesis protein ThiJ [Vibrio rotiferianus]CAH1592104.1 Thiamine biosynthesis protein ThiJ [Vibrio rotiferianus]
MTKRTLVLLYPGAISYEVMYAIECLGAYGRVDITTPENHNHTDSSGLRICPTVNFEDICITDYQALLIPGGNPDSIMGRDPIASFIQKAYESSLVIGGICAGVLVLARAGILKGVKITHNYTEKYAPESSVLLTRPYWEGAIYEESLVQVDKRIVTAMPNGYVDFGLAVAEALELLDRKQKQFILNYHKQGAH